MFQPLGFRTTWVEKPEKFDPSAQSRGSASKPTISELREPDAKNNFNAIEIETWKEPVDIVMANTNGQHGFSLVKGQHRDWFCIDDVYTDNVRSTVEQDLAKDPELTRVAIGEIRPTDVATFLLKPDPRQLKFGAVIINRNWCPSGISALHSFSELMRQACLPVLDLRASEIDVGLYPQSLNQVYGNDFNQDGLRTARIFIADRLENGAGFAPEIASAEVFEKIMNQINQTDAIQFDTDSHQSCESSCMDCVQSWENRFMHHQLDWRLALDVADLAMGEDLTLRRWFPRSERIANLFK